MQTVQLIASFRKRIPWLNLPVTFLVMLLQKAPVINILVLGDEAVPSLPSASILKSALVAVASVGSVHTLVGASGILASPSSLSATVGVVSNVVFTVTGTSGDPSSWSLSGVLPPGMNFSGLTAPGIVNVTTSRGQAILTGTPTTAGTYTFYMTAYWYPNATGLSTNQAVYTVTVKPGAVAPPVIVSSPPSTQTITSGGQLTLAVSTTGASTYQWQLNGVNISGATQSLVNISPVSIVNAGVYTCVVSNSVGSVTSQPATVIVQSPPLITSSPPSSQSVPLGSSITLSVIANGSTALSYQWQFNGVSIFGANTSALTLNSVTASSAGSYTCVVSNLIGSATSTPSVLSIVTAVPTVTANPISQTMTLGSTFVFSVGVASNAGLNYQWKLNGVSIPGATKNSYLAQLDSSAKAGSYTCVITNAGGSVTSSAAQLTLLSTTNPGHLVNLSVLTMDGPGSQLLTLGFVNGGSGTNGSEPLLMRATGPALTAFPGFSASNVLADPTLTVYQGNTIIASNDNWGSNAANIAAVNAADAATGAFALTSVTSLDAVVVQSLPSVQGGYTIKVAGNGTGVGYALAEVYDNTAKYSITSTRLMNLSCLQQVPAGGDLAAGFAISGDTSKTVLIRVSGPTLASYGVPGTMIDPQLKLYSGTTVIASNSGWAGDASITAANTTTGAFQFASAMSLDSAVVITLAPGQYTVHATSASMTQGSTMIEVYDVP